MIIASLPAIFQILEKYELGGERKAARDMVGIVVWTFFCLGCAEILASIFLFLTFPRLPIFYFSVLGVPECWKYAFLPLQSISIIFIWANTFPYINIHLAYILSTKFWMCQIW